jgi:hypothetical protein
MTTLTLLVKASNPRQLKQIDDLLKDELGDLDLEVNVLGNPVNSYKLQKQENRHLPRKKKKRAQVFGFERIYF